MEEVVFQSYPTEKGELSLSQGKDGGGVSSLLRQT